MRLQGCSQGYPDVQIRATLVSLKVLGDLRSARLKLLSSGPGDQIFENSGHQRFFRNYASKMPFDVDNNKDTGLLIDLHLLSFYAPLHKHLCIVSRAEDHSAFR